MVIIKRSVGTWRAMSAAESIVNMFDNQYFDMLTWHAMSLRFAPVKYAESRSLRFCSGKTCQRHVPTFLKPTF